MKVVEMEAIKRFPIRADHCDKKNADRHFIFGIETVMEYIEGLPVFEVAGEGKWVEKKEQLNRVWHCSVCDKSAMLNILTSYCPSCGARMRGVVNEINGGERYGKG